MRRSWLIAAIVFGIVAIAIAVVVLVTRLTEDDNPQTSPAAWATSVCTSLSTWRASIASLADVGGGALTSDALRDKLDEADSATEQLVDELAHLGPPDLDAGDAIKRQLDAATDDLKGSLATLAVQAEAALEADSSTEFIQALAILAPQYQLLLNQVEVTIARIVGLDIPKNAAAELERAFADAPSCQELRSDS